MSRTNISVLGWMLALVVVAVAAYVLWRGAPAAPAPGPTQELDAMTTPQGVTLHYHASAWGLAAAPEPILAQSYIPPCDAGYDYCFYLASSTYPGTNFESAGVRVNARTDLTSESMCLTTPPAGYTNMAPTAQHDDDSYATSLFAKLGDAAAGHYSSGALYRLYQRTIGTCTEFETRIGETQYANYPEGTIGLFSASDRAAVEATLRGLLESATLGQENEPVVFPPATTTL